MDGLSKLVELTKGSSLSDHDSKLYVSAENAARTLYLADLPRNTSYLDIAEYFENRIGSCLIAIKRPLFKNFYFAFVQFPKLDDAKKALAEHRFPVIKGSVCRVMPFKHSYTFGASAAVLPNASDDPEKTQCQLFVKNLPKEWTHADLYQAFEPFGSINSAKVSIDAKFISRGYGFVEFKNQEDSLKAVQGLHGKNPAKLNQGEKAAKPSEAEGTTSSDEPDQNDDPRICLVVVPFEPKRNRLQSSEKPICPNLYVKQFPVKLNPQDTGEAAEPFSDTDLRQLFEGFGELVNAAVMRDSDGRSKGFGFVSFKDWHDAKKALEQFNQAEENCAEEDKASVLYVREAKSKEQRELEIAKKTYQFKKSMMYLNLLVRNVDPQASEAELKEFFEQYGVVSNVKFNADCEMAFVSFKDREAARAAKLACPQVPFKNRYLLVSYVEPRETRQLQQEEKMDKRAFEKHQMTVLSSKNSDLISLVASLGMLMGQFANSTQRPMQEQHGGMAQRRGPLGSQMGQAQSQQYNQNGQVMRQPLASYNQNQNQYATQNPRYRRVQNPLQRNVIGQPHHQQRQGDQQQQFVNNQQFTYQMPLNQQHQQMPYAQQQIVAAEPAQMNTKAALYADQIQKMFESQLFQEATQEKRREIVGTAIYHHVEEMIGQEHAPKITGMIIDLQPADLNLSIQSYAGLHGKVTSAMELLVKSNLVKDAPANSAVPTQ